jgi:acylphosphatase
MRAGSTKTMKTKTGRGRNTPASSAGTRGMDHLRAQVIIHGIVQGVFFRANTRDEAVRIGVGGWVRNLPDGTVQALFEGEKKKVEEIIGWCHKGPPGARVSRVDIFWEPYKGDFRQFDIRYGYDG